MGLELAETSGVEEALSSLGDPADLARKYRAEGQIARAECSSSPLVILQGLRHTSHSWSGRVAITALYIFGWAVVVTLWRAALDKLFTPSQVGLWSKPEGWPLALVSDGRAPAGGHELLGWWLVPLMIVAGFILRYLVDRAALRWLRRYRESQAHQTA